jgi:hypothetical protein
MSYLVRRRHQATYHIWAFSETGEHKPHRPSKTYEVGIRLAMPSNASLHSLLWHPMSINSLSDFMAQCPSQLAIVFCILLAI